jgi:hypothetical protein
MRIRRTLRWANTTAILACILLYSAVVCAQPSDYVFQQNNFNEFSSELIFSTAEYAMPATAADIEEDRIIATASVNENESGILILQMAPPENDGRYLIKVSAPDLQNIRVRIIDKKGKLIKRMGINRDGLLSFDYHFNFLPYYIEVVQGEKRRVQFLAKKQKRSSQ